MDCNSNTCPRTAPAEQVSISPRIIAAAEKLAALLTGQPELQDFVRLTRNVQLDGEVNEILSQMNNYWDQDPAQADSMRALEDRLEALPVVIEFRAAEQSIHDIFATVDQAVSAAAGVPFAENAQPAACG